MTAAGTTESASAVGIFERIASGEWDPVEDVRELRKLMAEDVDALARNKRPAPQRVHRGESGGHRGEVLRFNVTVECSEQFTRLAHRGLDLIELVAGLLFPSVHARSSASGGRVDANGGQS